MTQKALGDAIRINQTAIQEIETGRVTQAARLLGIAKALRMRPEQLSSGAGTMGADSEDDKRPSHINHDMFKVNILDPAVSTDPGIVNQEFMEILRSIEYAPAEMRHAFDGREVENIRIINIRGNSMPGTIESDGPLFVDINVKSSDDDRVHAFLHDDTAYVEHLQRMKDKLLIISDNKGHATRDPIERDEMDRVFVFGKVTGSMPQTYRRHG